MMESITITPIGQIISGRETLQDDFWGNQEAVIEIDSRLYSA
ncbi:hypothetical protein ACOI1C_11665 [Bacillus sp. DJP31]